MPANYHRPGSNYVPVSRPNDKKFEIYTRNNKRPVPDVIYDQEFGNLIDITNALDIRIDGVQVGDLPGIDDALNVNKLLTLSQLNTVSWVYVSSANVLDESLPGIKLIEQTITERELADGGIPTSKIAQQAITTPLLADECNTLAKQAPNSVDTPNLVNGCVTLEKQAENSVDTPNLVNGCVTTDKLANQDVTLAKLAQEVIDRLIPIGTVVEFAGTAGSPAMWLECNGQAISRATYATLFTNLGTIYGVGDGATTFNLPDRRGRVAVGIGSDNSTFGRITAATADSITLGGTFGAETQTLDVTQIPPHTHSIGLAQDVPNGINISTVGVVGGALQSGSTGDGLPHPNVQPSIFTRYYIRAL